MRTALLILCVLLCAAQADARMGPSMRLAGMAGRSLENAAPEASDAGLASGAERNLSNHSFARAKRMLEEVYKDRRETLYCGFPFDAHKRVALPDGFTAPAHPGRSAKVEWEHAVPAENFGRAFPEWDGGSPECVDSGGRPFKGRKCVEKANPEYRYMQADMHNLFPAVGSVNAVRSNFRYSELPGVAPSFGVCPAKVEGNRFEPPDRAKGQVARAALYMDAVYPKYSLSRQQRRLFEAWDAKFPVTEWECARAKRIARLQRNDNMFVRRPCERAGLW